MKTLDRLTRCIGLMVVVLLLGCSAPEHDPLPPGSKILAFGDSLTAGVGAPHDSSYPTVLARLTGLEVINAGISGETTAQGRSRLPDVLDDTEPDLLILLEGGNDILRNRRAEQIKANLAAMIEHAQRRDIIVVLLGVPQKKLFSDSAPLYPELADEFGVIFDDELVAGLLRSPSLKSDPIHLNAQGYSKMARLIQRLLAEHGLLD